MSDFSSSQLSYHQWQSFWRMFAVGCCVIFSARAGFCCTCAPITDYQQAIADSAASFVGEVLSISVLEKAKTPAEESRIEVVFKVKKKIHANQPNDMAGDQVVIKTYLNRFSCKGYVFEKGERYLVVAMRNADGSLGINLCGGTSLEKDAPFLEMS